MGSFKRLKTFLFVKHKWPTLVTLFVLLLAYWLCLPSPLFNDPTCTVIEDREGNLLGARIALDGQWRFPATDTLPNKFCEAIIAFEDKRFYSHPGFDPIAFARAMRQNIRQSRVVSGGSTLTMQVIRLARKGKQRTVFQKLIEVVLATRLEIACSKQEILAHYASNAPFGGNVVGIDAASWRYFGKTSASLTWAEAATLAVLPNSPSLIHFGRNREKLQAKRDQLLKKLYDNDQLDSISFELALLELLPEKPHPLPQLAPHLLDRAEKEYIKTGKVAKSKFRTTLSPQLQRQAIRLADRRIATLEHNQIHNLAILVLEVKTGNVVAYVGNVNSGEQHGQNVDVISAPRSSGSLFKPLLFCKMLQEGEILPQSLVPDIPTYINGYRPENFHKTYDGVVSAKEALIRSLNVPFVKLLQRHGLEKFHFDLKKLGLTTINRPVDDYGLTLILGGAETTLWDITNLYACMARRLGNFYPLNGKYASNDLRAPNYLLTPQPKAKQELLDSGGSFFGAGEIWLAFDAMIELERPDTEGQWQKFISKQRIAWKTGTSYGFRDAWAIGVSPEYAVGVWVGNADGEGRPGLVGVHTAAPILFEVFDLLPESLWFDPPYDAMKSEVICAESGYLASPICPIDTVMIPKSASSVGVCPYHKTLFMDETMTSQVNTSCYPAAKIKKSTRFVLPATEAYYYKAKQPGYQSPPPELPGCNLAQSTTSKRLELIYPKNATSIYVPTELDGSPGKTIFKVAHQDDSATVFWHIDNVYIGSTTAFHSIELSPTQGPHLLVVVDGQGNRLEQRFQITSTKPN